MGFGGITPPRGEVNSGLSKLPMLVVGFAPCFAERLRLSGRNLPKFLFLCRGKAQPSRGREEVV